LTKRRATAGQRTAATIEEEETAVAPDVGLGAGPSAASVTLAREETATAATTTTVRKVLLVAMMLAPREMLRTLLGCVESKKPRTGLIRGVCVFWRDEWRLLFIADEMKD
jgi:hypothetical protein